MDNAVSNCNKKKQHSVAHWSPFFIFLKETELTQVRVRTYLNSESSGVWTFFHSTGLFNKVVPNLQLCVPGCCLANNANLFPRSLFNHLIHLGLHRHHVPNFNESPRRRLRLRLNTHYVDHDLPQGPNNVCDLKIKHVAIAIISMQLGIKLFNSDNYLRLLPLGHA